MKLRVARVWRAVDCLLSSVAGIMAIRLSAYRSRGPSKWDELPMCRRGANAPASPDPGCSPISAICDDLMFVVPITNAPNR
jgi:hypothetical protein